MRESVKIQLRNYQVGHFPDLVEGPPENKLPQWPSGVLIPALQSMPFSQTKNPGALKDSDLQADRP